MNVQTSIVVAAHFTAFGACLLYQNQRGCIQLDQVRQAQPITACDQGGEADTEEIRPPVVQLRASFGEHLGVTTVTDQATTVMKMVART